MSIFNLQYDRQHVVKLLLHQLKAILDFAVKAYICIVPALSRNVTVLWRQGPGRRWGDKYQTEVGLTRLNRQARR